MEGKQVLVHVLENGNRVADIFRQMHRISHPHVAKLVGRCRQSRSILVEGRWRGSLEELIKGDDLTWQDSCRIAHEVASAVLSLSRESDGVRTDPELIWLDEDYSSKVFYIPGGSSSTTNSFGALLKDLVEKPLRRFNTISEARMDE